MLHAEHENHVDQGVAQDQQLLDEAVYPGDPNQLEVGYRAPASGESSGIVRTDAMKIIDSLLEQLKAKDALIEKLTDKLSTTRRPPKFIDIGWGSFNIELVEVIGEWAEQNEPPDGPVDPKTPRVRVRGESFTITQEEMLYLQREVGVAPPQTDLHDKFAALVDEESCLNKAHFGEPIFILRAQDELSAELVRLWADQAEAKGCRPEKCEEARLVADMMENYPGRKSPD